MLLCDAEEPLEPNAQMYALDEGSGEVVLWDFTGYAGVPAEEIPPAGTTNRMKFYFEGSHFTPLTGGLMLDRIYRHATNDFGTRISTTNVEAHLQSIRAQRENYVARFPADVEWVHRVSKQMLAGRRLTDGTTEEE